MRKPTTPIPKFRDTYPSELATVDELRRLGLRPGTNTPTALLEYHRPPDTTGICALYERVKAVPMMDSEPPPLTQ